MGQNIESAIVGAMVGQLLGKASGSVFGQDSTMGQLGGLLPLGGALAGGLGVGGGSTPSQSPLEKMIEFSLIHPGQKIPVPGDVTSGKSPLLPMHAGPSNTMQLAGLLGALGGGGRPASPMSPQMPTSAGGLQGALQGGLQGGLQSGVQAGATAAVDPMIQDALKILSQNDSTDWLPEISDFEGDVY